jgi:hypothetical protein
VSDISLNENAILALLSAAVPYLLTANGGTLVAVGDPALALLWQHYTPPAAVLAFSGSVLKQTDSKVIGQAVFEEFNHWELYLIAASFGPQGEGRTAQLGTDPDAYKMIGDARAALYGKTSMNSPIAVKVYPANPPVVRWHVEDSRVVYKLALRTNWLINQ